MSKVDEQLIKMKSDRSQIGKIMEDKKSEKLNELETARTELELEKIKGEIKQLHDDQKPVDRGTSQTFLGSVMTMAQVDPKRAKEFLESLTEEDLSKLSVMSAMGQGGNMATYIPLLKSSGTSMKDIIEVVKFMQEREKPAPQSPITLDGVAKLISIGFEAGKVQNQQLAPQQNTLEQLKLYHEMFVKPLLDTLTQRDKDVVDMKMRELESKIVDPVTAIKHYTDIFKVLGLNSGGKTELDLKDRTLQQSHELDKEKITWEKEKYALEQTNRTKTLEEIRGIVEAITGGPIGEAIKNLGAGAAERIKSGASNIPLRQSEAVQINCPQCGKLIWIDPNAQMTFCGQCGVKIQKQEQPAPSVASPTGDTASAEQTKQ